MEESKRVNVLSSSGFSYPSVKGQHLHPSYALSRTSAEDFIHWQCGSESQLYGTTYGAVTEASGGNSTNGSETPDLFSPEKNEESRQLEECS